MWWLLTSQPVMVKTNKFIIWHSGKMWGYNISLCEIVLRYFSFMRFFGSRKNSLAHIEATPSIVELEKMQLGVLWNSNGQGDSDPKQGRLVRDFLKSQKFPLHKSSEGGEREYRRENLSQNEVQTGEWDFKTEAIIIKSRRVVRSPTSH